MWIKPGSRRDAILISNDKNLTAGGRPMDATVQHLPFEFAPDLIRRLDRNVLRNVCMVFDPYLREAHAPQKFSRVI